MDVHGDVLAVFRASSWWIVGTTLSLAVYVTANWLIAIYTYDSVDSAFLGKCTATSPARPFISSTQSS